ncbi:hypothetical protein [Ensifer sp. YR511]|uniref:hypothetical protein n=1 Tax=Ensifer sp. YR511 TaxID=1855294 RepID=UPI00088A607A|nr:hypothetical protein [Ensifer sp. YR511]SDO23861.1 hypothetical protein SAMN05216328_1746 [Ensifer sp. YR511]
MREMKTATIRSPDERGDWCGSLTQKVWLPLSTGTLTGSSTLITPTRFFQWLNVLKIAPESGRVQEKEWGTLSRWKGPSKSQLSYYLSDGFGHGLPVRVVSGDM